MIKLEQLQLLAQLIDSMEIAVNRLDKSYEDKDNENFRNSKNAIIDFQQKISRMIQGG